MMESRLHLQCLSGDVRHVCVASWDCTNDQELNEACKNKYKGVESALLKPITSYNSLLVWLRLISTANYMYWNTALDASNAIIRSFPFCNSSFCSDLFCNCLILRLLHYTDPTISVNKQLQQQLPTGISSCAFGECLRVGSWNPPNPKLIISLDSSGFEIVYSSSQGKF